MMNAIARKLLAEAMDLPDAERAELAAGLIESLDHELDSEVATAWGTEVQRRVAELDAGLVAPIPWPEARKLIMGQADGLTAS